MDEATILLVEADVLVRVPLGQYLRECGYKVVEAAAGDEAKALLDEPGSGIEIVLTNVNAKEAGFTLATWVRTNHPHVDVVLAGTVAGAVEKAGNLCEDGPAKSVPYDHKLLHERIRQLLAARVRAGGEI